MVSKIFSVLPSKDRVVLCEILVMEVVENRQENSGDDGTGIFVAIRHPQGVRGRNEIGQQPLDLVDAVQTSRRQEASTLVLHRIVKGGRQLGFVVFTLNRTSFFSGWWDEM